MAAESLGEQVEGLAAALGTELAAACAPPPALGLWVWLLEPVIGAVASALGQLCTQVPKPLVRTLLLCPSCESLLDLRVLPGVVDS